jgi:hypothetical protein
MPALPGCAPEDGAALAIHVVATVEDFEILRRIDIASVKVWLLGAMATGASLFQCVESVPREVASEPPSITD